MIVNQLLLNPEIISPSHYTLFWEVVQRYPYFSLGRYGLLLAVERGFEQGIFDERELERARAAAYSTLAMKPFAAILDPLASHASHDLIDEFLEKEEPWSAPVELAEQEQQEDISIESATLGEQTITETLARIYAAQGLNDKAIDIYYKLSLKYPEKSVYFATLIDSLNEN